MIEINYQIQETVIFWCGFASTNDVLFERYQQTHGEYVHGWSNTLHVAEKFQGEFNASGTIAEPYDQAGSNFISGFDIFAELKYTQQPFTIKTPLANQYLFNSIVYDTTIIDGLIIVNDGRTDQNAWWIHQDAQYMIHGSWITS